MALSVRAYNALQRVGVTTRDELAELTWDELIRIPSCGLLTAKEIIDALHANPVNGETVLEIPDRICPFCHQSMPK